MATGALTAYSKLAAGTKPMGIAISPDGKNLYVGHQVLAQLWIYSRTEGTELAFIESINTNTEPRAVAVSPDGKNVYITHYGGATGNKISQYVRNTKTGLLTPCTTATVATGNGPSGIAVSPNGRYVYACCFTGGTIRQYRRLNSGELTALSPTNISAGTNPNGITVSPDSKNVYAVDRASNTVLQYSVGAEGGLTALSPATVATEVKPYAVVISPDGLSAYVGNGAEESISMYSRGSGGALTSLGAVFTPKAPHLIAVSPDNLNVYVANYEAAEVSQYTRSLTTGLLKALKPETLEAGSAPQGVVVSPDGRSVYASDETSGELSTYTRAHVLTEGFAARSKEKLEPWLTPSLEIFAEAAAAPYETILEVAQEEGTEGEPGWVPAWGTLLNPNTVPYKYIPWLAMFVGVQIKTKETEPEARATLKAESGLERGTRKSLELVLKKALGTLPFLILERETTPYRIVIVIPSGSIPAATYTEINSTIPAGILYEVVERAGTWYAGTRKWSEVAAGKKFSNIVEGEY